MTSRTTTRVELPAAQFDNTDGPYYALGLGSNLIVGVGESNVGEHNYYACQIAPDLTMTMLQELDAAEEVRYAGGSYVWKIRSTYLRQADDMDGYLSTSTDGVTWAYYDQSDIFSGPI